MNKFEIGEMVRTIKGIGWVEVIMPNGNDIHYSVRLSHNNGIYWFTRSQVFKYEDNN